MAAASKKPPPEWLIDLHGMRDALTTGSKAQARVIAAIESGEMLILRSVSDELKAAFPELWADFTAIKPKKYFTPTVATYAVASQLQQTHGSPMLGGMPDYAHFEAVAAARSLKCKLVTGGNAFTHCHNIASKCGIPVSHVVRIKDV